MPRGWSETNYIAQLHSLTPKQLIFGQESTRYRLYKPSYGEFSVKIFKFTLPWQQALSEQSLTNIIKLTDPEYPQ